MMKTCLSVLLLSLSLPLFAQDAPDRKAPAKDPQARRDALVKELGDLRHQVEVNAMKLEVAKLQAQIQSASADAALAKNGRESKASHDALAHFNDVVSPRRVTEARIGLDAASNRAEQAKDEHNELVAMYKQEEFAEMTKELVLKRSRHSLDLANRRLAVEAAKLKDLESVILPRERDALKGKATDADASLHRARLTARKTKLDNEISLKEASHKLASTRQSVKDTESKLAKLVEK